MQTLILVKRYADFCGEKNNLLEMVLKNYFMKMVLKPKIADLSIVDSHHLQLCLQASTMCFLFLRFPSTMQLLHLESQPIHNHMAQRVALNTGPGQYPVTRD
jgi:hypothetical protein